MAESTRKTPSELLAPSASKIALTLQKRRLIPFKSLPTQMGTVAALTYCLKQHPTLLTLTQVMVLPFECPSGHGTVEGLQHAAV